MATRWRSLTLVASFLVGCPAPVVVTPEEPVRVDEAPEFRVEPPPPPQATKMRFERPAIEEPERVGCRHRLARWSDAGYELKLYLGVGKPAWGRLKDTAPVPVEIALDRGVGGATAEMVHSGTKIRSVVHTDELRFRPRVARVLDGFAVPLPGRTLRLEDVKSGAMRVSLYIGADFASSRWIRAQLPCGDIGLGVTKFEPPIAKEKTIEKKRLPADQRVALMPRPGDKAVAELAPKRALWVEVIERRAGAVRIRWSDHDTLFFGWVDESAFDGPTASSGMFGIAGVGEGESKAKEKEGLVVRCREELPLVVWQRGHARTVGTLGPDARFVPSVMFGDLQAIDVRGLDIALDDGSFYTVAAEIPKLCEAVAK